jgi:tripartite-type tricarboxylate transporter receptor subunit TctC
VRGIKAYAVTSDTRQAQARGIPTFGEMGPPALSWSQWYGFLRPKGTPKDIIAKLNAVAVETVAADLEFDIVARERQTPEGLGAL